MSKEGTFCERWVDLLMRFLKIFYKLKLNFYIFIKEKE